MMPVASIPSPSDCCESLFGWAPVVPLAIIPSVPNLLRFNPFPSNGGNFRFSTPTTYFLMTLVRLHELHALCLSGEDVFIFIIYLTLGLAKVFLVSILVRPRVFGVVEAEFFIKISIKIFIKIYTK